MHIATISLARACKPSTCSHLSVKHGDSHPLRTRSHRHRVIKHKFLSPCNLNCGKPCTQSCACNGAANFPSAPLLGPGPSRHTQKRSDDACAIRHCSGGMGWAERRAASSSYQTLSHFFPQRCSLHPWSPKLVCPDKIICLACLPSFRPGRWLPGSGQALILNFPNFRSGVRPAAPPPAPTLPLTPQGCLICKSGSLCKFWGRGVRWAGLRALVKTLVGRRQT